MLEERDPHEGLEPMARDLEVLASPTRLELLHVLREPRPLHEIRVHASRSRTGERIGRPISRQAVTRHLEVLQEADLVRRLPGEGGREGDRYLLNHEHVFALVDEVRNLAKLRPLARDGLEPGRTLARGEADAPKLPPGPRLLVAYGRDDGVSFSLDGPPGTRWRIGRAPGSEVHLDYDPYLSGTHAILDRDEHGIVLRDSESRNGTWVNWRRLAHDQVRILAPGDLLTVGRSLLVFQP